MTDEPREAVPVLTPEQLLNQQKKTIWRGCQSCLGCGGIALLLPLLGMGGGPLLQRLSIGGAPDLLPLVNFQTIANEMTFGLAFGSMVLLFAASRSRASVPLAATLGIPTVALLALYVWAWWIPFVAIRIERETVTLDYLWPRPSSRLDLSSITSVNVDTKSSGGGSFSRPISRLELTLSDGRRLDSAYGGRATEAAERIQNQR